MIQMWATYEVVKVLYICVSPQIGMNPILVWGLPDLEY